MIKFEELNEQDQIVVVNAIAQKTPCDENEEGLDFVGKIIFKNVSLDAKGYISPDGKVFRFTLGDSGPFQWLSDDAALGFSAGDSVPSWAEL